MNFKQIASELDSIDELSESAWSLPAIPFDASVTDWPGSGNTLYSAGNKELTQVFQDISKKLELVEDSRSRGASQDGDDNESSDLGRRRGWFQRLFG